ncbi:CinA family protein [Croceicoccus hydrothermalis]|uniref:CinA family protein n=1 Tax=Croceicoccus hydrothermalis TaxID=2867964 RepID=UPI001EFBECC3|nr:CinA family protein [Croceicoccus hydrothermalis]
MTSTLDPILPDDLIERAHRVLDLAHERKVSLTTAESCTGGLLAALLTDVRGRGHAFDRGIVTYSVDAKCDLLDIDRDEVESCGAVSRPIAIAMARGALNRSRSAIAVSITGYAGPGGDDAEEGLVHFGCAVKNGDIHHREEHFGAIGRSGVRKAALNVALDMMEQELLKMDEGAQR